jgi:REP element-mobilizing transposase RayT
MIIRRREFILLPSVCTTGNDKIMILNDAGKMVERWNRELGNKYPDKRFHEMVIMPNHFHCIIENMGIDDNI